MRVYDWNKERVEQAVKESNCWFDCLMRLGVPKVGGNYRTLKNKVREYQLDVSHFSYKYAKTHNGKHMCGRLCNRTNDQIFAEGSRIKMDNLKKVYIERILSGEAKCEKCGITQWQDAPIVFQIHHIDGNHQNHSIDNIILLCPNCHSQTENYSNRKRKG